MAIKMTAEQYQKTYGSKPLLGKDNVSSQQTTGYDGNTIIPSVTKDLSSRTQNVLDTIASTKKDIAGAGNSVLANLAGAGQVAGSVVGNAAGLVADTGLAVGKSIINRLNNDNGETLAKAGSDFLNSQNILGEKNSETISKIGNFFKGGIDTLPPNVVESMSNFMNTIGLLGAGKTLNTPLGNPVSNVISDVKNVSSATKEALTPAINKAGTLMKSAAESSAGLGIAMEAPVKQAVSTYESYQPTLMQRVKNFISGVETPQIGDKPVTEVNTALRKGLVGTEWQIGVQAKKVARELFQDTIQPALNSSDAIVNKKDFFGSIKKRIISENADLTRRKALLEALDSFEEDYKHVNNFGLPKLQEYKEGWAKFIPEKTYNGKPIGAAFKDVQNMAAENARQIIYKELGDEVKTAYLDYGNLQSIDKAGQISADSLRSKGVSRQVWEAILDKTITPISTFAGQVLYKTGNGLELYGKAGAKTIRDIIK